MGEPTILTQSDIKTSRKYLHISLPLMDSSRFLLAFYWEWGVREVFSDNRDRMVARRSSQTVDVYCSSQNSRHLQITVHESA